MAISFGKKIEEINNLDITVIKNVVIGKKTISKDGPLNFSNETIGITNNEIEKTNIFEDTVETPITITQNNVSINENSGLLNFGSSASQENVQNIEIITETNQNFNNSPLTGIAPAYTLNPIIPGVPLESILNQISSRCLERILDELDNVDPTLRLQQLLDLVENLCSSQNFTSLQNVINKIQQTKRDLIYQAMETITDPLERIAKLHDMLVDAINTGAEDLVSEIVGIINNEKFNALLEGLDQLDPRNAIEILNNEIRRFTDLRQFEIVNDLLSALQIIQDQFREFELNVSSLFDQIDNFLDEPENFLNNLQQQINDALDLNNLELVQDLINTYDSYRDQLNKLLAELDPNKLIQLANEALSKLDLGRYNRILQELSNKLCNDDLNILPNIPNIDSSIL